MSMNTIQYVERISVCGYCTLKGRMSDGSAETLFSYYIDELTFRDNELVGLTVEQARSLRHQRDVAYMRS
jgi:hypothetical protein